MVKISAILFTLLLMALSAAAQSCKYDKNGVEDPPYVWAEYELPSKTVHRLKGKVLDANDEPVPGTVVAVHQITSNGAKFIGSYEIDTDGKFCFGGLKKGKYQIKIGKQNFQRIVIEVNLEPMNKNADKNLLFNLEVGL